MSTRLTSVRCDVRAQRLTEHVDKVLADWPPLSEEQLDRIAAMLCAGSRLGGDAA